MTCKLCKCRDCRNAIANARIKAFLVSRETPEALADSYGIGPAITTDLPLVEAENERMRQKIIEQEQWRDTEADALAEEVLVLAAELARAG